MAHNDYDASIKEIAALIAESEQKTEIKTQTDYNVEYAYWQKMHEQQELRTEEITKIFQNYRTQQNERYAYKMKMKPVVFRFLLSLIAIILLSFVALSIVFVCLHKIDAASVVALVSILVTCLGSILSILIIIVKYIFPEDEDKNFNDVVTTIIENDTKRIKDDNDFQIGKRK